MRMEFNNSRTDLPVVLLYDLDPALPPPEIEDHLATIQQLLDALI